MKAILAVGLAALVMGATPAFADPWKNENGHGRHGKHSQKHAEKHWKKEHKRWEKEHKHWAKRHRHVHEHVVYAPPAVIERRVVHRVVEHHYPVPVAAAPAPGIHVVLPNIYMPF